MAKKKQNTMNLETIDRQKSYVDEQEKRGGGQGLVFADAFIRGIRDIGYRNTGWALSEQVDNAIQAGAKIVSVRFGYNRGKKPEMLAVIDDGVGMIPKMISYAVRWGGTDREDDRTGFGRYGYGLPSSAVSFCTRYTVYSKVAEGEWHAVVIDLPKLAKVSGDIEATDKLLAPQPSVPPKWVMKKGKDFDPSKMESGTIVVHEHLDRHTWKLKEALKAKLLSHLGVVYRNWIPTPKLFVDETAVEPLDPLFLMETGRYFDAHEVRAKKIETKAIEIEGTKGKKGSVKVRASYLHPKFQKASPDTPMRQTGKDALHKGRFEVMRDYNGLLICRDGRQIDCVQPRWTKFQNYDVNVKIEIDFDPELDEFFGITTSKQQIVIADEMWDRLEAQGGGNLRNLVRDIRKEFKEDQVKIVGIEETKKGMEQPRASEQAMQDTEKFKPRPDKPSDEKKAKAREELENAAAKIAETTGRKHEEVAGELEERTESRRFEVEFQSIPEGPFYRPKRLGQQKRLIINTQHPFYEKVYDASPGVKSALEVLLLVLAEGELEAEGDFEKFYKTARGYWSERLHHALDRLLPDDSLRDAASAVAEELQMTSKDG